MPSPEVHTVFVSSGVYAVFIDGKEQEICLEIKDTLQIVQITGGFKGGSPSATEERVS